MRSLILLLALAAPAFAQTRPPTVISGEWVGPLEFRDSRGMNLIPTRVTLTVQDGHTLSGEWVGLTPSRPSGTLRGTIDDRRRVTLTISIFSGAEDGGTVLAPERCAAEARFSGDLHPAMVFRWTSDLARMDTPAKRARDIHCEDMRRLVWTLQRAQ